LPEDAAAHEANRLAAEARTKEKEKKKLKKIQ
jgi:hypothetical protein